MCFVKSRDGVILTYIYSKLTDTKHYLNLNSCHPKHTKVNIPLSLASRIIAIISDVDIREQRLQAFSVYLRSQTYSEIVHGI